MHCETRVGDFVGDIGELAHKYSTDFFSTPIGRPDVIKYALLTRKPTGSYFLMVSNTELPNPSYNVIVTVMGPAEDQAKEIMADFESNIPIELRSAPESLQRQYDGLMGLLGPK